MNTQARAYIEHMQYLWLHERVGVGGHAHAAQFELVLEGPRVKGFSVAPVPGPPPPVLVRFQARRLQHFQPHLVVSMAV